MIQKVLAGAVRQLVRHDLRKSFRRVCVVGDVPQLPEDRPAIAYANHNHFYDGHLLWLVAKALRRSVIIWMEEWDRFPFFAAEGAMPFPSNDSNRRSMTIRRTVTRFNETPPPLLAYFPDGVLTPPEQGPPSWDERTFRRLGRIMPSAIWMPVAIHVTWWGESLPTALLWLGEPQSAPSGDEVRRLAAGLDIVRSPNPPIGRTLLEGSRGANERWNLGFTRRFFSPC